MSYTGTVYCLRGLPGSGKSRVASALACTYENSIICSADAFLMENGKYIWTKERVAQAHAKCQALFKKSLQESICTVIVDNVNSRYSDIHGYKALAIQYKYRFVPIMVGTLDVQAAFTNNVHEVPWDTIEKMAKKWEWDLSGWVHTKPNKE
jgi:predicted kinase